MPAKRQLQFADLKRKLADVTPLEWDAIPEIGDYTIKKQKRFEKFMAVPDTLLAKALAEKETSAALDPRIQSGLMTPAGGGAVGGAATSLVNLTAVGEVRALLSFSSLPCSWQAS